MSYVTFDGHAHTITLIDQFFNVVGTWPANNRTANDATLHFVPNGWYSVQDKHRPYRHGSATSPFRGIAVKEDSVNGEYGVRGIIHFNVPPHTGVGVHAGRRNVRDISSRRGKGPNFVTLGCIRTTDEAMAVIAEMMKSDPLYWVHVVYNRQRQR